MPDDPYSKLGTLVQDDPYSKIASPAATSSRDNDTAGTKLSWSDPKGISDLLGVPYRFGGEDTRSGIDCSSFTRQVYSRNGVKGLPRTAQDQWTDTRVPAVKKGSVGDLQAGDQLFFQGKRLGAGKASHTAYFAGYDLGPDGTQVPMMYAASSAVGRVVKQNLNDFLNTSGMRFLGAKSYRDFQHTPHTEAAAQNTQHVKSLTGKPSIPAAAAPRTPVPVQTRPPSTPAAAGPGSYSDPMRLAGARSGKPLIGAMPKEEPTVTPSREQIDQFRMRFFNTNNRTANIPIQTAHELSINPNNPEWRKRFDKMKPISKIAIAEKAAEFRAERGRMEEAAAGKRSLASTSELQGPMALAGMIQGPEAGSQLARAQGFVPSAERFLYALTDPAQAMQVAAVGPSKLIAAGFGASMVKSAYDKFAKGDTGGGVFDLLMAGAPVILHGRGRTAEPTVTMGRATEPAPTPIEEVRDALQVEGATESVPRDGGERRDQPEGRQGVRPGDEGQVRQAPRTRQAKVSRQEVQKQEGVASPAPIKSAAYRHLGVTYEGANHPEILQRVHGEVPEQYETASKRNTPNFGFVDAEGKFLSRRMAAERAKQTGQDLVDFEPKEQAHSDEIAAQPGGTKPISEGKPAPTLSAKSTFSTMVEAWRKHASNRAHKGNWQALERARTQWESEGRIVPEQWQMTRVEAKAWGAMNASYGQSAAKQAKLGDLFHRDHVRLALSEGKPVPPEVLAEYPDLKPPTPPTPPAPKAPRAEAQKSVVPDYVPEDRREFVARSEATPTGAMRSISAMDREGMPEFDVKLPNGKTVRIVAENELNARITAVSQNIAKLKPPVNVQAGLRAVEKAQRAGTPPEEARTQAMEAARGQVSDVDLERYRKMSPALREDEIIRLQESVKEGQRQKEQTEGVKRAIANAQAKIAALEAMRAPTPAPEPPAAPPVPTGAKEAGVEPKRVRGAAARAREKAAKEPQPPELAEGESIVRQEDGGYVVKGPSGTEQWRAAVEPAKPTETAAAEGFGTQNKVFTKEKHDAALDIIKKRLSPDSPYRGAGPLDTELVKALIDVGGYYAEGGLRSFGEWRKRMQEEVPGVDDDHLRAAWNVVKGAVPDVEPERVPPAKGEPPHPFEETSARKVSMARDRAELDLPGLPEAERKSWQTTLDRAQEKGLAEATRASTLAKEVNHRPRALDDEETAGLVLRAQEIKNAHADVLKGVINETNPEKIANAREQMNALEEEFDPISAALKKSGTEKGRSLAAQKLTIGRDYSLVSVKARAKAEKGTPLSNASDERFNQIGAERERLNSQIADLERQAQAHVDRIKELEAQREVSRMAREDDLSRRRAARKADIKDIRLRREEIGKTISKKLSRASAGVPADILPEVGAYVKTLVEEGVARLEDVVDRTHTFLSQYIADLDKRSVRDAISGYGRQKQPRPTTALDEQLKTLRAQAKRLSRKEDIAAGVVEPASRKAAKTRIQKRIEDLERRIAERDFAPVERTKTPVDQQLFDLQKKRAGLEYRMEQMIAAERKPDAMDYVRAAQRFSILSGVTSLGKISAATNERIGVDAAERLFGVGIERIPGISAIAKQAPGTGRLGVKGAVDAFVKAWSLPDMWSKAKSGASSIDREYFERTGKAPDVRGGGPAMQFLELPGRIHASLKLPAQKQAWSRGLNRWAEFYANRGADITSPEVQVEIATRAYEDGMRAIFRGPNPLVDAFNRGVGTLEQLGKSYGPGAKLASKAAATLVHLEVPVVRIPTNIASEAALYSPIGILRGAVEVIANKGIRDLSPTQADLVMRALRKGGVGTAMMALAYYHPGGVQIAGSEDDPKHDLKRGEMRIFGTKIPAWATHHPLFMSMNLAATARRMKDAGKGNLEAWYKGASGEAYNIPFISNIPSAAFAMRSERSAEKQLGRLVGSFVPAPIADIARAQDKTPKGDVRTRYPQDFTGEIKMQIPGLRQQVSPVKPRPQRKPSEKVESIRASRGGGARYPRDLQPASSSSDRRMHGY